MRRSKEHYNRKIKCIEKFNQIYKKDPTDVSFCPYRICPLGAHVDHQLGRITGLAIEKLGLDDELLVIAGDNLLDFSLTSFMKYAKEKNASCIMSYYELDEARLHKSGVVTIDETDKILKMVEKPAEPESHWCCPPFYFYTREDVKLIQRGIDAGCGTDAPGSYIAWLSTQVPVYAFEMPGRRYDIGNLESYRKVEEEYFGIVK